MYIARQEEMKLLDQYTMDTLGLPGVVLMENAGSAVVNEILEQFPNKNSKIIVITGGGNNGGDGFVIARRLSDFGYDVVLYLAVSENRLIGDAKIHFNVYKKRNLPMILHSEESLLQLQQKIASADLIVDALLGTGASGDVRSPFFEIIQFMNESCKVIFSVDIPSGLNANTGEVCNIAVKATKTITFAMPKIGFFVGQGPSYIGTWKVVDISVPEQAVKDLNLNLPKIIDKELARAAVPKRITNGHKGTFGHCLVVGGCTNYVGAPIYSAKAAFQTGVGLVTLAVPVSIYSIVASQCPECLLLPLQSKNGGIDAAAFESIDFSKYKVVAFGPGLSRNVDGHSLCSSLLAKLTNQTIVVDADGLFFFKDFLGQLKDYKGDIIFTPHPGEMSNLIDASIKDIENNRIETAKQFALDYGVFLLLKGHRPILTTPNGEIFINPHGNDALGKGGSGDVLTGIISSFAAQGASSLNAMIAASFFHAKAAEELGNQISNYGITPNDIMNYVSIHL